jgi:hypothetical protein
MVLLEEREFATAEWAREIVHATGESLGGANKGFSSVSKNETVRRVLRESAGKRF